MGWNDPNGDDRDPWGRRPRGDGPPDLDEVVRKMQDKLGGIFGGGGGGGGGGLGGSPAIWLGVAVLLVLALIYECAHIIQPAERGVVLRFGRYVATLDPGLNFRLPRPIEYVLKVDVDQVRSISHSATMLTQDENIVDIELAVQYKVKDVTDYLFEVRDPDRTVQQATSTAVREVIGTSNMDFVLTAGRSEIQGRTRELIQEILDNYRTGLIINSVNMQPAKPPEAVKAAFDDAIKAREDQQRLVNEAEAYRNEVLPQARGQAARLLEEAQAYKQRVIARAEGDASRFGQLLVEYEKAPAVTRERLYLDAVEEVLARSPKVLLDTEGSGNLMYLPLDKLMERVGAGMSGSRRSSSGAYQPSESSGGSRSESADRNDYRSRGTR